MNPQKSSSPGQSFRLIFVATLMALIFLLLHSTQKVSSHDPNSKPDPVPLIGQRTQQTMIAKGNSQDVPQDSRIFGGPERKLYNGVPPKLPLRVNVKNVTSEKWVHELEVEITNTSDKPIYFLDLYIFMSGVKFQGKPMGFWLHYGRVQLISFSEPILPDDDPIKPGEKHTFKIQEADAKGWDTFKIQEGRAEPKHLELMFQGINFGDGTGFRNTSGEPVNIHRKVTITTVTASPIAPNLIVPVNLTVTRQPADPDQLPLPAVQVIFRPEPGTTIQPAPGRTVFHCRPVVAADAWKLELVRKNGR